MAKIALASATLSQLVAFANVGLGLEIPDSPKPTKASVTALLSTVFSGDEIEVSDEDAGSAKAPLTVADTDGRKKVRINIGIQEGIAGGNGDVPVGVNGTICLIMRGKDVDVPVEYVEVLKNAQKMVYDRDEVGRPINGRLTMIYPFSVVAILD